MDTAERPLPPEIWDSLHPAAHALIRSLQAQVTALQEQVQQLQVRLDQNSQNSSRPPSSDAPKTPPRRRPGPSGRQPGGQPGHAAHQRALLPADQVDGVVEHWPERCTHCQAPLAPTWR